MSLSVFSCMMKIGSKSSSPNKIWSRFLSFDDTGGRGSAVQPLQDVITSRTTGSNIAVQESGVKGTKPLGDSGKEKSGKTRACVAESVENTADSLAVVESGRMVDVRSSQMMKPSVIGSPPPSVLRERSKMKRERLAQSRLATGNTKSYEETVLPSTGENPAIHLSCSDDMSPQDEEDIMDIRELGRENPDALGPNRLSSERNNSLTPPPRLISFNLTESSPAP